MRRCPPTLGAPPSPPPRASLLLAGGLLAALLASAAALTDDQRQAAFIRYFEGDSGPLRCPPDEHADCAAWAARGECLSNPRYMRAACAAACAVIPRCARGMASVAAAAAETRWHGHATAAGTGRWAAASAAVAAAGATRPAVGHFRQYVPRGAAAGEDEPLTLSSLGLGTYLGGDDAATDEAVTAAVIQVRLNPPRGGAASTAGSTADAPAGCPSGVSTQHRLNHDMLTTADYGCLPAALTALQTVAQHRWNVIDTAANYRWGRAEVAGEGEAERGVPTSLGGGLAWTTRLAAVVQVIY